MTVKPITVSGHHYLFLAGDGKHNKMGFLLIKAYIRLFLDVNAVKSLRNLELISKT